MLSFYSYSGQNLVEKTKKFSKFNEVYLYSKTIPQSRSTKYSVLHLEFITIPQFLTIFLSICLQHECWGECDWHLLSASLPQDSKCQILCGKNLDDSSKLLMNRLGTDYRLDAGIIALACIEFILALLTTFVCSQQLFGFCNPDIKEDTIAASNNPTTNPSSIELAPLTSG